jgi:hypothetical protein
MYPDNFLIIFSYTQKQLGETDPCSTFQIKYQLNNFFYIVQYGSRTIFCEHIESIRTILP